MTRPLASDEHGQTRPRAAAGALLLRRASGCSTPAPARPRAAGGNRGPSLRLRRLERARASAPSSPSTPGSWRSPRATSAGSATDEQQRYTTGNARIQLDPSVWEMPGAMPEIAPSPDFVANIDRPLYDRSMVLQAWGTYGTLWPVVHHQLGRQPRPRARRARGGAADPGRPEPGRGHQHPARAPARST